MLNTTKLQQFESHRSFLMAIAYQMLGTVSDAEDMVQEAFIKWQSVTVEIKQPKSYLATIVTRLCLDRLRYLKLQREKYTGFWLPEPIVHDYCDPGYMVELADSLSIAFLVLLEELSPTERAIFILKEVFSYRYGEISPMVGKNEANCRQIAKRARHKLQCQEPAFDLDHRKYQHHLSRQERTLLVEQFIAAWNNNDLPSLLALLKEDVTHYGDGGGNVTAALKPLLGKYKVAKFLIALRQSSIIPHFNLNSTNINNQPGILVSLDNQTIHCVISFQFGDRQIKSIFAIVNPEKLNKF